jgi:putative membrane protein
MSGDLYTWIKAAHLFAVIAWMAGMFYLPRLYVYHTQVAAGSDGDLRFQTMERRLLRGIMDPAMIGVWVLGIILVSINPYWFEQGWLHVKLVAVIAMSAFHGLLSRWRRDFEAGRNRRPERFYRAVNEVPTLLLVVILVMVVVKPF